MQATAANYQIKSVTRASDLAIVTLDISGDTFTLECDSATGLAEVYNSTHRDPVLRGVRLHGDLWCFCKTHDLDVSRHHTDPVQATVKTMAQLAVV